MSFFADQTIGNTVTDGNEFFGPFNRGNRVVALTLVMAGLNVPDLWSTVAFYEAGQLCEGNPMARYILDCHGIVGLSVCKTVLVALAIWGFLLGRRLLLAEIGCAIATCVYLGIAWLWTLYPQVPHAPY